MTALPLKDAVARIDAKTPIGSTLRSADWARVPVALRERAQFSAGVTSARVLQGIQDRIAGQLKLQREQLADGKSATFDRSSFIDSIREIARDEGLAPDPDSKLAGGLQDITSIPRLGLIYDMQTAQAQGYATWKLDQSEGALLLYPAQEFLRVEDRKVPRLDWKRRFAEAAQDAGDDDALRVLGDTGRMVALKNSGLWSSLSEFETPWPPFDWGSGMGLEDVDRAEAIALGLLQPDEVIAGAEQDFNDELKASVSNLDEGLVDQLKDHFGKQIKIEDGNAWWKGDRSGKRLAAAEPAPAAPEPIPAPPPDAFPAGLDGLRQIETLGGSTGAVLVEHPQTGQRWVMKRGNSPEHVREEFAADQIYRAAGLAVPEARLYQDSAGQPVKLAQFIEGQSLSQYLAQAPADQQAAVLARLQSGFAVDALVGNWDVAGMNLDNILVDKSGIPWRIDNGGSLRYRAQGAAKTGAEWSPYPTELWTMRDSKENPQTARLFSGSNPADLAESILKLDRAAMEAAAPPEVRDVLARRLDNLRDAAQKILDYQEAKFTPAHGDRIAEEIIRIRQSGISDRLPKKLTNSPGDPTTFLDESGQKFDFLRQSTAPPPVTSTSDPSAFYWDKILPAIKTVNAHHAKGDTAYNQPKVDAAIAQKPALRKLAKSGTGEESSMAKHYLDVIKSIEAAKGKKDAAIPPQSKFDLTQPKTAVKQATASTIDALAAHMKARGGDWSLVASWASDQGGSSGSAESARLNRWLFDRMKGVKPSEFYQLPAASALSSLTGSKRVTYDRTFEIFHAFCQEVLGQVDFPSNDRQKRTVTILRGENSGSVYGFGVGQSGVYARRINASGSLVKVPWGAVSSTEVPHPRITGLYWFEQQPKTGSTFFYGDHENEFTYMAHGLPTKRTS